MKTIKVLFAVFLFTTLISSCESDDPLASVKYQIAGYDNAITMIKYNGLAGNINVSNPNDFGNGGDSKKLAVNVLPFTAKLEVGAGNPTAVNKIYNLKIFVNGVEKANYDLNVAAGSSAAGSVEYIVNP